METILAAFEQEWDRLAGMFPRLTAALIVLLVVVFLAPWIGRLVARFLERSQLSRTHKAFFRRLAVWIVWILGFVVTLGILGLSRVATSLVAGGGVTAIVLGFAFREIGENLLAGLFLAFSRPFNLGDLIRSGDFEGTVRNIELRSTHIRSADGADIFIPNAQIFNQPLVNFTLDGLRKLSLRVGIDYGELSLDASRRIEEAVKRVHGVLESPPARAAPVAFGASYLEIDILFWINSFEEGGDVIRVRGEVIEAVRKSLREAGILMSSDAATNLNLGGASSALRLQMEKADSE